MLFADSFILSLCYHRYVPQAITIHDIGSFGEGIGKLNGLTVFVPGALPQDRVEIELVEQKKNFSIGRVVRHIDSPLRTTPRCPLTDRCGGCQIQHLDYAAQLEWKRKKVSDSFKHIAKIEITALPTLGMTDPYAYRNKAQFPVGLRQGQIETGFYALGSHAIVDTEQCPIQHPLINKALQALRTFLRVHPLPIYNEDTHKGLLRHLLIRAGFRTQALMICLVINGSQIPHAEALIKSMRTIPELSSLMLNINTRQGNLILGDQVKTLWGRDYIEDKLGDLTFRISPLSFFQVNPVQAEVLYRTAVDFAELSGRESVWDLYCGIGTLTSFLAKKARLVYGLDEVPAAIMDAKANAQANRIRNVTFFHGKAEFQLQRILKQNRTRSDVVVIDPPRKGCEENVLRTVVSMEPRKIVYVSCDPATLARDASILTKRGYQLQKVQPVDMFPHTVHVECVAQLTKI